MQEPSYRRWVLPLLFLVLAAVPFVAQWLGEPFYVTLGARILIYALAALALNLVLGFAGLVSFGHAMFLGLGCYAVGILSFYGIGNGWVQLAVCIVVCALVALVVGTVCLRTSGIGFIMITLAFAQMFYFLAVSLREYGGDDGLNIYDASAFGLFDLGGSQPVYWAAWGLLLANLTAFASPSYMSWPVSGELIVMVVIGGLGNVLGPIFGAVVYLLMEEAFKSVTQHWMLLMGPVVVVIAMLARGGYGRSLAWLWPAGQAPAQKAQASKAEVKEASV